MLFRSISLSALLLLAAFWVLATGGCSSSQKIEIPILYQSLPANSAETPVDIYWSSRSLEGWLKLPGNPKKEPDLTTVNVIDTHGLWENFQASRKHEKVADVVVSGHVNKGHPREWLLLELGQQVRGLGAHGVVVNSLRVADLTGQARRGGPDATFVGSESVKVWIYAQAVQYK